MTSLSISVVVYQPRIDELARTLNSFGQAYEVLRGVCPEASAELFIVDNGGFDDSTVTLENLASRNITVRLLTGHGNVGYGRGHNLAIGCVQSQYHLVLNPDVDLDRDALLNALAFFGQQPRVGLITPRIGDTEGNLQYLCRRYPAVLDLFIRGFIPFCKPRRLFERRLARYEMRDLINEHDVVWDPPIVSGCFMLFRTTVLKELAGFDPRYFLYFEDYDLSLRTHKSAHVAYVPTVKVLHHGGGASRKGRAHMRMFSISAFKFFNRFGWKWI